MHDPCGLEQLGHVEAVPSRGRKRMDYTLALKSHEEAGDGKREEEATTTDGEEDN
jgi:hypothetical protein